VTDIRQKLNMISSYPVRVIDTKTLSSYLFHAKSSFITNFVLFEIQNLTGFISFYSTHGKETRLQWCCVNNSPIWVKKLLRSDVIRYIVYIKRGQSQSRQSDNGKPFSVAN
jgi:hypothetical protein